MPRSFLVKKEAGGADSEPCPAQPAHDEIDVVGDSEDGGEKRDGPGGPADARRVTQQQLSPAGAIAMVASHPSAQQLKTSPSIAPQLLSPHQARSLSPDIDKSPSENTHDSLKFAAYRRYSDPKFWQNTLPSITHHYVSPFNFHRLPHAILASNSHSPNLPFQNCLPLSPPTPDLSSYSMTTQAMFRPSFEASRMALSSLAQFDHRGEGKMPYAFVQPTPNPVIFPSLRSPVDSNHVYSTKTEIHKLNRGEHMKMSPTSNALAIDNNNSAPSKTLPWLHELPYNLAKDLEVATERVTRRANEPPRYQCDACKKSYATFSGLSKHKQFHCESHVKKEFSCKYCEKTYNSLGALKMHIRTHTLPCKCQICGKAFSRPWLLQGHLRTHTGEKPFVCPQCGRAFADRSNLRAHLQTHSDIKKYSCTDCSKTFSRMSLLVKHKEGSCPGIRGSSLQTMIASPV